MNGTRVARNISAGMVASLAAWSSYSHMVHVALATGERPEVAYALPFSVDGMLVVASVVMADDKKAGRPVRKSARVAFVIGVAASLGANVANAHPSIGARIVAGWPALALLLVVEMLAGKSRGTEVAPVVADVPAPAPERAVEPRTEEAVPVRTARSPKRTTAKSGTRTDDELLAALVTVPKDDDGTVPVRRAAKVLGTGPDRARRLLTEAGLRPVAA